MHFKFFKKISPISLIIVVGFFVLPISLHALIIDQGVRTPEGTPPPLIDSFNNAIRETNNPSQVQDFIDTAGINKIQQFILRIGGGNITNILKEATGKEFGSVLKEQSISDIANFVEKTSSGSFGQLINQIGGKGINNLFGQVSGTALGDLVQVRGVGDIASVIQNVSAGNFGDILGRIGVNNVINIFDRVGAGGFAGGIRGLGSDIGVIGNVFGNNNLGSMILSIAEGSIGNSFVNAGVSTIRQLNDAVGVASAASTVVEGIEEFASFTDSDFGGTGIPIVSTVTDALTGIFGSGNRKSSGGGLCSPGAPPTAGDMNDGGETHVPVKDFTQHKIQKVIGTGVYKIANDTNSMRTFLQDLCIKEYQLDPQAQNKWVLVAENLVKRTIDFVNTAYNGNPIYISNPYSYFNKVSEDILITFYSEVELNTNIDKEVQFEILQMIKRKHFSNLWPNEIKNRPPKGNTSDIYQIYSTLVDPFNNPYDVFALARDELEKRLVEGRRIEEQKLAWGQGFFSYEICDDKEFLTYTSSDRRNCRIITPGSIIKNQTALVLGTALRQIENADEYNEKISQGAFSAFNSVLNSTGLRDTKNISGGAVGPDNIESVQEIKRGGGTSFPLPDVFRATRPKEPFVKPGEERLF